MTHYNELDDVFNTARKEARKTVLKEKLEQIEAFIDENFEGLMFCSFMAAGSLLGFFGFRELLKALGLSPRWRRSLMLLACSGVSFSTATGFEDKPG